MEVRLNPDKEARLAQIAGQQGLRTDESALQILNGYVDYDDHFIDAVNAGMAAAAYAGRRLPLRRIRHGAQDRP